MTWQVKASKIPFEAMLRNEKKILKTKILWKQHRPGWTFCEIGRQNGKSTRKLKRTNTKSSIKCCKYFMKRLCCILCRNAIVENKINKKSHKLARAFLDLWSLRLGNFENFRTSTHAHISGNALALRQFPILIAQIYFIVSLIIYKYIDNVFTFSMSYKNNNLFKYGQETPKAKINQMGSYGVINPT